jgi:hypothetical protein
MIARPPLNGWAPATGAAREGQRAARQTPVRRDAERLAWPLMVAELLPAGWPPLAPTPITARLSPPAL